MHASNPIYTELTQCQDCYKCVRRCPVKAIQVRDGSAAVIPDDCIYCGTCTLICPVGAKKVRDDLSLARQLIATGKPVYASLAPSFRSEFAGIDENALLASIRKLGFAGVSETALGAQEVSAACARMLQNSKPRVYISTACPVVVRLVERYYPQHAGLLTDVLTPVQTHCRQLRQHFGDDIGVVFFSPCIAKKNETDEAFNVSLTFADLRRWLNEDEVELSRDRDEFVPHKAEEGGLYPVDGGMNEGVRAAGAPMGVQFMHVSGVYAVKDMLEDIDQASLDSPIFIEALACEGGCVNGPAVSRRGATVLKRTAVLRATPIHSDTPREHSLDIRRQYAPDPLNRTVYSAEELAGALLRVGKKRREDELNCGGCGYDSCRDFAAAMLDGRAEPSMCVSHLRKQAQNKANALLMAMPSGVVIVDKELRIIECNPRFVDLAGGDARVVYDVNPDLEGAMLERLIPFHDVFREVLDGGVEQKTVEIEHEERIIRLTVFTVEKRQIVGGVLQDVTKPVIQSEQIIQKASEVMKKNLTTVQQIAFLLGENAAESEVLLQSIISSFSRKG